MGTKAWAQKAWNNETYRSRRWLVQHESRASKEEILKLAEQILSLVDDLVEESILNEESLRKKNFFVLAETEHSKNEKLVEKVKVLKSKVQILKSRNTRPYLGGR